MKLLALIATVGFALVSLAAPAAAAPAGPGAQPQVVPNHYIVTLKPTANLAQLSRALQSEIARERESTTNGGIVPQFGQQVSIGSSFKAVTGTLTDDMVRKLKNNGQIASVEPDHILELFETTQLNPPSWGLPRISRRTGNEPNYSFPDKQGEGVDVYVIDSGIEPGHVEFRGINGGSRARSAFQAFKDDKEPADDGFGHGTHVAGTIAGIRSGVAKRARIHAIKILNKRGLGTASGAVFGMAFAANEVRATGKTAVCNMSFGFYVRHTAAGGMTALDLAATALFEAGCVIVKAAGNSKVGACTASPGRVPQGLTVAALAPIGQTLADYSNIGRCVNIAAPGSDVVSAGLGGRNVDAIMSGTSMAAPHVAGAAALILGEEPQLTPQQVVNRILARATEGVIQGDLKGGANRVVYIRP